MSTFKVGGFYIWLSEFVPVYEKIYSLTSKINRKYCELNGYDYRFDILEKSVLDNLGDTEFFDISPKCRAIIYKYKYMLDNLEKSAADYMVYVEYDACFCNDFRRLENYVDGEHDIFYSRCNWSFDLNLWVKCLNEVINEINRRQRDIFDYEKCSETLLNKDIRWRFIYLLYNLFFCNEGFFILKNSEISRKFLKAVIKYTPLFYMATDLLSPEGQTVQCIMSKDVFTPHIKVLPPQTQGHIWGNSNQYSEDECLVCHNSSMDRNMSYQILQTIAGNKYWSKYKFLSAD